MVIPAPSVKKELPDIDLSAPMPPPSPSDDPLLLSGPILPPSSTPTRPPKERELREVGVVTSAYLTHTHAPLRLPPRPPVAMSLPPSSSPVDDMVGVQPFDWARHMDAECSTDLSMMGMDEGDADVSPVPLFDLNLADLPASSDAGGWSDSDDDDHALRGGAEDEEEGEGEYTGRWKMVKVRTKLDPPSSATKERMEEWGRPITPFPKRIAMLDLLKEVHGEEEAIGEDVDMSKGQEATTDEEEEREVRELSVPLDGEDDQGEQEVRQMSVEFQFQDLETPHTAMEGPFDFDTSVDISDGELSRVAVALQEELDASFDQHDDDDLSATKVDPGMNEEDEEDEEEREVRQMSVEFDDEDLKERNGSANLVSSTSDIHDSAALPGLFVPSSAAKELSWFKRVAPAEGYEDVDPNVEDTGLVHKAPQELEAFVTAEGKATKAVDGYSSDDGAESDSEDAGVVKITSADPRAAARAAAILKQVRLVDVPVCAFLILFAFDSMITIALPRL